MPEDSGDHVLRTSWSCVRALGRCEHSGRRSETDMTDINVDELGPVDLPRGWLSKTAATGRSGPGLLRR